LLEAFGKCLPSQKVS